MQQLPLCPEFMDTSLAEEAAEPSIRITVQELTGECYDVVVPAADASVAGLKRNIHTQHEVVGRIYCTGQPLATLRHDLFWSGNLGNAHEADAHGRVQQIVQRALPVAGVVGVSGLLPQRRL